MILTIIESARRAGKQSQCQEHEQFRENQIRSKGWFMFRTVSLPSLTILIAAPRGFCAGVDRAIRIVELTIEKYGAPVYVRHEIVHNRFVVDSLKAKGAIFVDELDQVPDGVPVV